MDDLEKEKLKEKWFDLHKERTIVYHEAAQQQSIAQFNSIVEYSKIAINGAFLLNGMAGIAVLYNIARLGDIAITLLQYFSWGAALAVLCAGISYVTQRRYSSISGNYSGKFLDYYLLAVLDVFSERKPKAAPERPNYTSAHVLSALACVAWAASLSFFFYAGHCAFSVLRNMPQVLP